MDPETIRFTDRMGLLFEAEGRPRIAGRIFGRLLVSEEALSLDQLAADLAVSKASASTNARLLAGMGMLERACRAGDRHDYYRVTPDLFERTIAERLSRWQRFTEAVAQARRSLPIRSERVRDRLRRYETAYGYLTDAIAAAVAQWEDDESASLTSAGGGR